MSRPDQEEPRFERREPDRGSRVREDEIGERWPEIPEWADPRELDPEVRRDLRGLSKEGAEFVGAHLFMAGMLAEEDPQLAWRHARAARSKGGRIAVVRETVGLVAYHAGEWAEAIAELRAARRMSGGPGQLPVMADCERALGHPEKAIELSRSAEAADLDPSSTAELRIVVAGARADLGQLDAALAHLESAVQSATIEPYSPRLFYAYADLLLQADRRAEAVEWFMKAAEVDVDEDTDAGERLTELAADGAVTDVDAPEVTDDDEVFDVDPAAAAPTDVGGDDVVVGDHEGHEYDDIDITGPDESDSVARSVLPADSESTDSAAKYVSDGGDDDDDDVVDEVEGNAAADLVDDTDDDDTDDDDTDDDDTDDDDTDDDDARGTDVPDHGPDDHDLVAGETDGDAGDTPIHSAGPPNSMSSLFSHNEGGM